MPLSSHVNIGRQPDSTSYWNGQIDEVRLYNAVLSTNLITELYNSYTPEFLVAAYPFAEGSGTTTADASGHGYDGTLMNDVAWTSAGIDGNALSFYGVDD